MAIGTPTLFVEHGWLEMWVGLNERLNVATVTGIETMKESVDISLECVLVALQPWSPFREACSEGQ